MVLSFVLVYIMAQYTLPSVSTATIKDRRGLISIFGVELIFSGEHQALRRKSLSPIQDSSIFRMLFPVRAF